MVYTFRLTEINRQYENDPSFILNEVNPNAIVRLKEGNSVKRLTEKNCKAINEITQKYGNSLIADYTTVIFFSDGSNAEYLESMDYIKKKLVQC